MEAIRKKGAQKAAVWTISRIIDTVAGLASDPYPTNLRKLAGSEHSYRIRVGDYSLRHTFVDLGR